MKKTKKKVLGILGLSILIAMTVFAAMMPDSNANAISSATDTIEVKVVNDKPDIKPVPAPTPKDDDTSNTKTNESSTSTGRTTSAYSGSNAESANTTTEDTELIEVATITTNSPLSSTIVTSSKQEIGFSYASVGQINIIIQYTDKNGILHESTLDTFNANYEAGDYTRVLDLSANGLGYGDYVIKIVGVGADGVPDEGIIAFSYYPIVAKVTKNKTTGATNLKITYDIDYVDKVKVNLYDANDNLLVPPSPIFDTNLDGSGFLDIELLFSEYELLDGTYRFEMIAFDKNGNILYKPISLNFDYDDMLGIPKTEADTFFSSREYIVLGVVVFLSLWFLLLMIVLKRRKS